MGRLRSIALGLLLTWSLPGQEKPPVFSSDVRLVRLVATVKDFNGKLVGNLDKSDFRLLDNGVKQEVALFERTTEQPLSIALLIDTSASIAKDLKVAVGSVKRFLAALLREGNPNDEVALFSFNHEVQIHTSYTRDLSSIDRRLQPLKAEAGTSLYDGIHFAARSLQNREGRHAIVIVTDGGDTTSYYKFQDALEQAHRSDAAIYSLLLMPITNDAGRNVGGENALTTLGESTGGRMFTPNVGSELDQALSDILRDLRTQYLIGYYPRNVPKASSRFHHIRVDLNRSDLRAVTRTGYFE